MSSNDTRRQTTFADIRDYELQGAAAMATPAGPQRWCAIRELCQRMRDTEPVAFDEVADWVELQLRDAPIIAYTEPFGEWWRQYYNASPIRLAGWGNMVSRLEGCAAAVSVYAPLAIGIYAVLLAQVPADSTGDNQVPDSLRTPQAEDLFKKLEAKTAVYRGRQRPLLDRTAWPWKPITMNAWIHIASWVKDSIGSTYADWEAVVGGRNFRQRVNNIGTPTGFDEIMECIKESGLYSNNQ